MRSLFPLIVVAGSILTAAACSTSSAPQSTFNGDGAGAAGAAGGNGQGEGGAGDAGAAGAGDAGAAGTGIKVDPGGVGAGGGETCAAKDYGADRVPANILILLDRSGSMQDGGKWGSAVSALSSAVDSGDDKLSMGILRFPEGKFNDAALPLCLFNPMAMGCPELLNDNGCQDISTTPQVGVAPLSSTRAMIKQVLNSTSPNGGTPTRWALRNAWDYMKGLDVQGDRYVLLVTDGEPTTATPAMLGLPAMGGLCGTLGDIAAETLEASGGMPAIKTFVIGAPGSDSSSAQEILSGIAFNGGTGKPGCSPQAGNCHYQIGAANFQEDLKNTLSEIAGKVASCVFAVPSGDAEKVDPNFVNVSIVTGGGEMGIFKDVMHKDGWDYTDSTQQNLEIFGPQCDAIKAELASTVKVALGCATKLAEVK
jgi:hypothetical protein